MKTVVTETGSVYEFSCVDEDGYVFVSRKSDYGSIETLRDDTFPMLARVNGYDTLTETSLDDVVVGNALQILPVWRHEANIALGSGYVGIVTSPVTEIS